MTLPIPTGSWTLDASHTTVSFTVRHLGISKVRGTFPGVDAQVVVGDSLDATTLVTQVDMATVDTGDQGRDAHLRSADFFDVEAHPTMTFESTAIREDGDDFVVDGILTIKGRSNPLTLAVEFHGLGTYPMDGSVHAGFSATGTLSRKEFGIDFNVPMATGGFVIGDKISIELDVQLAAEAAVSQPA
jgi:polyisoprenoid-binding protein YceI